MSLNAAAIEHWMQLLRGEHGASTIEELLRATEEFQLKIDGTPYCTALRPIFVEPRTCAIAAAAAETVNRALRVAADRIVQDEGFRRALGFPRYIDELIELDRPVARPSLMSRIDGLFDRSGELRFIEFNASPGGVIEVFEPSRAFARMPIAREFGKRFPFEAADPRELVADALLADLRERRRPPPVGLALITSSRNMFDADSRWIPYLASRGAQVFAVELSQLEVRAEGVYVEGKRIDHVLIEIDALVDDDEVNRPLLEALRDGRVDSMFGISQAIAQSSKLTFEALSDPAHASMFDAETQQALRRHIPWTRRVRECRTRYGTQEVDLLPLLSERQERFVLKPAGSSGGEGVVLGWTCDRDRWQATLGRALKQPYVAQERVEGVPELYPLLADGKIVEENRVPDFNPFLWNARRSEGFVVRVGRNLHNVHDGGSMAPTFILRQPGG